MNGPESRWRDLLDLALPALDHVFGSTVDTTRPPDWTLGGGTAIALRIAHRISHDVDVFVPGVALKRFTPASNPKAALISPLFQYPGHYIKFERPEGEIDFLSPPLQTAPGYTWLDQNGRPIALETLEEVIVKKIRFRSVRFAARDIFDLAAVAQACAALPTVLAAEVPDALKRTREAVDIQADRGADTIRDAVIATHQGEWLVDACVGIARETLDAALRLLR